MDGGGKKQPRMVRRADGRPLWTKFPPMRARNHSVMSVYVTGMGWVDIKPWRPG